MHLTKEDVDTMITPHDHSVDFVEDWLRTHGINEDEVERSDAGDWLWINISVGQAEKMLSTYV
jgi:tripeptidyl-peptidase-1